MAKSKRTEKHEDEKPLGHILDVGGYGHPGLVAPIEDLRGALTMPGALPGATVTSASAQRMGNIYWITMVG